MDKLTFFQTFPHKVHKTCYNFPIPPVMVMAMMMMIIATVIVFVEIDIAQHICENNADDDQESLSSYPR